MSHILAIEPDRRQAARLNAIARVPLNTEMVIVDTAEAALAAISKRVPDLILTPRLMSPKDEALLDSRLRELDGAGWNVQTLMIPMLGGGTSTKGGGKKEGGLLNRLRRGGEDDPSGGCDPMVFAEEINEYLERGAAERALKAIAHEDKLEMARASEASGPEPVEPVYEATNESSAAEHAAEGMPELEVVAEPHVHHEAVAASGRDEAWQEISLDDQSHDAPAQEPSEEPMLIAAMEATEPLSGRPQGDTLVEEFVAAGQEVWTPPPATDNASRKPAPVLRRGDDDWGYFDPQRIGFAALLEQLQEAAG